jgi:catechol 2,3-dioxygenase-like lactoylglutathione lyase family enzyme
MSVDTALGHSEGTPPLSWLPCPCPVLAWGSPVCETAGLPSPYRIPMKLFTTLVLAGALALAAYAAAAQTESPKPGAPEPQLPETMELGNFSVSLSVKDLKASEAFYKKLDFQQVGGKHELNYLIMQNETTTIGLFQGMFDGNILTFNPGWNKDKETLKDFDDVREIQHKLKGRGIRPAPEADEKSEGPASFIIEDPDGNMILFDQHVPKPKN